MACIIVGSERSPFVRACRMLMLQNAIQFEFKKLNFVEDAADAAELKNISPVNKVPVLIDDGQKIFDSRVIANYLIGKHSLRPLSLDEENRLTAIYSLMDTGVLFFLMKRDGLDTGANGFFLSRLRDRVPDNLNYLKDWASTLGPKEDWHFPAMMLLSFLRWGEARAKIMEVAKWPEFRDFMSRFQDAPGVRETDFM
jgi:glutathione S-transferase